LIVVNDIELPPEPPVVGEARRAGMPVEKTELVLTWGEFSLVGSIELSGLRDRKEASAI
jgi:hypothetical protein